MSSWLECFLIIGLSTVLSVAGMCLVRKRVSRAALEACHEVAGFLLAIVGTLYAILVGMIVVSSQAKVDQASAMAVSESNTLSNMFHLSNTFSQPSKHEIRQSIHAYAEAAFAQDWSKVEEGLEKEETVAPYRSLWKAVTGFKPEGENQKECYSLMLENLEELSSSRKYRMVAAKGTLPPVLWAVLIAGGIMIVLFTYFFFLESLLAQILMTACVAIFLSMNVYLIYICQNPYRPELGAKDAGFGFSFTPNWFIDETPQEEKKQ